MTLTTVAGQRPLVPGAVLLQSTHAPARLAPARLRCCANVKQRRGSDPSSCHIPQLFIKQAAEPELTTQVLPVKGAPAAADGASAQNGKGILSLLQLRSPNHLLDRPLGAAAAVGAKLSALRQLQVTPPTKWLVRRPHGDSKELQPESTSPPRPPSPDHPTLQLLQRRLDDCSTPGARRDGCKVGLVVEGGGMRGVVTGAMLMKLHELGMRDCFDAIYGASAGAINATYFLSGQEHGLRIYQEDINGPEFVDLRRLLSKQPVMNLDFLLDHVMTRIKPLDWQAVLRSNIPLKVIASDVESLQPVVLEDFTSQQDLVECLKASANVPEFVGPPRLVRGMRLLDAAVFEPVPVKAALSDGCTHVVTLCSRPMDTSPAWQRRLHATLSSAVKHTMLRPDYMRGVWEAELRHDNIQGLSLDDFLVQCVDGGPEPAERVAQLERGSRAGNILPVFPGPGAGFGAICTDTATLERGRQAGFAAVQAVFGPTIERLHASQQQRQERRLPLQELQLEQQH